MQELLEKARQEFEQVMEVLAGDLATVKTGRAKPDLVESVLVEAYENQPRMKLVELATISAPDPRMLTIKPWDQTVLEAIAKAISMANLGLNPIVDGEIVRINIPALTEERRQDLVKLVKQKLESGRVLLRQARHGIKELVDAKKGKPDISEDDLRKGVVDLDKLTEEFMERIETVGEEKEKELMTI